MLLLNTRIWVLELKRCHRSGVNPRLPVAGECTGRQWAALTECVPVSTPGNRGLAVGGCNVFQHLVSDGWLRPQPVLPS